jgi:hypothetical protein
MNIREIKRAVRERMEASRAALKGKRFAEAREAAYRAEVLAKLVPLKQRSAS